MSARDNAFFRSNTHLGLECLLRDLERAELSKDLCK
jgi:hypothetical protein